jgi:hypothetical protein
MGAVGSAVAIQTDLLPFFTQLPGSTRLETAEAVNAGEGIRTAAGGTNISARAKFAITIVGRLTRAPDMVDANALPAHGIFVTISLFLAPFDLDAWFLARHGFGRIGADNGRKGADTAVLCTLLAGPTVAWDLTHIQGDLSSCRSILYSLSMTM